MKLRYHKLNPAPHPHFRLHPNPAVMQVHDFFAMRQADARAIVLPGSMQALEDGENALPVFFLDANAVVLDRELPARLDFFR